jgi:hypothetical protein
MRAASRSRRRAAPSSRNWASLPSATRRPLCRHCLDWSERRHHLAGALGTALLDRFQQLGWAHRVPESRVLAFSADGEAALRAWLD